MRLNSAVQLAIENWIATWMLGALTGIVTDSGVHHQGLIDLQAPLQPHGVHLVTNDLRRAKLLHVFLNHLSLHGPAAALLP